MSAGTPTLGAKKFTFSLNGVEAAGAFQLDPGSHPELLKSLIDPKAPLPSGDVLVAGGDLSIAPGQPIAIGPAKVGFSADVNAALGVFATPGPLREALLANSGLVSEVADALSFSGPAGTSFLMLRWGYDIAGTAAGSVAMGPSANLSLSANAGRKGYYAIVQSVPSDGKALESLVNLARSWKLPSQVDDIARLPVSTTLISEVDGSFGIGAKVTFGYDFNWLRTVDAIGLKGDVGLKLQAGLSASIGFGLSGKYAIVVSRNAAQQVHFRLYKLRVNDWSFGFDGSLTATPVTPLPDSFDDLLRAVTGTHGQQIMKLLGQVEDWTDPSKPVFGPFVNLADAEARKLVETITGVPDLAAAFDSAKGRIQQLFHTWDQLPQTATQLIWSKLPDPAEIAAIAGIAGKIATLDEDSLKDFLQTSLANVPFLNSTPGKALEALASKGLFAAIGDSEALKQVKKAAGLAQQILDGSALQGILTRLQDAVNTRLNLKQLEAVVDQTSFDSIDCWLKARLEGFLERKLEGSPGLVELQKLRTGLKAILDRKDELYAKALAVLKRNYDFQFHASYQKTTTTSALLDATFDFGASGSQAGNGLKLALAGKFDQLMAQPLPGVTIHDGVLAFGLRKESHVSLSLPYFSTSSMHVNEALAQLRTVAEQPGGLMFSLGATDLYQVRNDFTSALTVTLSLPQDKPGAVTIHDSDSASYRYDLKMALPHATAAGLGMQFAPYADNYFSSEFRPTSPGRFSDWVAQIAPPDGKLGNTLLSLSLSLPPTATLAWTNAPDSEKDRTYKRMSIALQRQFKQVLHDTFFRDVGHYAAVSGDTAAGAVLVFCSIPCCSSANLSDNGTRITLLGEDADGDDIYWDYRDRGVGPFPQDLRKAVLFHPDTKANLRQKLDLARTHIRTAGDPNGVLAFYADDQVDKILSQALHGRLLDFLFPVEAHMVEQARQAGLKMSAFKRNQFRNPEQARKDLAEFGQKFSEDFNTNLRTFAVDNALLPLGTAIYTAAAGALDPAAATGVTAMFSIQMLQAGVSTLAPGDSDILRMERVVHSG